MSQPPPTVLRRCDSQILDAGISFTDTGIFVSETGMSMDLQQQFRKIFSGQQGINLLREQGQAVVAYPICQNENWSVNRLQDFENHLLQRIMKISKLR